MDRTETQSSWAPLLRSSEAAIMGGEQFIWAVIILSIIILIKFSFHVFGCGFAALGSSVVQKPFRNGRLARRSRPTQECEENFSSFGSVAAEFLPLAKKLRK